MSSHPTAVNRDTLLSKYHQLSETERVLMQLYSVIYEPADIDELRTCLEALPKKIHSKKVSTAGLGVCIRKLVKFKLLTKQNKKFQCSPLVVELITRELVQKKTLNSLVKAVNQGMPLMNHWRGGPILRSYDQVLREARIGLYTKNFNYVDTIFNNAPLSALGLEHGYFDILLDIINNPFDADWIKTLPQTLLIATLQTLLTESILELSNVDEILLLIEELVELNPTNPGFIALLMSQLIFRGLLPEAHILCDAMDAGYKKSSYLGCLAAIQGDTKLAFSHFQTSLKQQKKETKQRTIHLGDIASVLFVFSGLKTQQIQSIQFVKQQIQSMIHEEHAFADIFEMLDGVLKYQSGDLSQREKIRQFDVLAVEDGYSLDTLFTAMGWYWVLPDESKSLIPILEDFLEQAIAAHYDWLAVEAAHLLHQLNPQISYLDQVQSLPVAKLVDPIVTLIKPVEPWELCLTALTTLNEPTTLNLPFESSQRLIWLLSVTGSSDWALIPKEQKINAKGGWSKGRAIALKRLSQTHDELEYLTEQDHRICNCIESDYDDHYRYYYSVQYDFNQQAIAELVGHPLVFWENAPEVKVEVVEGEPEILVKQTSQESLVIELSPKIDSDNHYMVVKETLTRVKIILVKTEHQRIATILGAQNSLKVPLEAKERVLEAINSISSLVTVHSDIGGGNESIEEVPSSAMPHLQLFPLNSGLNLKLLTRPFDLVGPYFAPGNGGSTVIAEIEGTRKLTTRDMPQESQLAQQVIDSCSVLQEIPAENFEWILDEPEDCLEVLLSMQALEGQVVIEWPEGEKFKLNPALSLSQFNMSLTRQRDWFAVEGGVQVDSEQVMSLQQLMRLLDEAQGRFLPLGEGQFLALTDTFRKRLEELRAISETHGKGLRLNPLASLALEDWMDEVGDLKTDKHWKKHIKRLKEVRTLEPKLPSTLQAELRDYQVDGFKWLARLSAWGVGACLADDMGLGKTIQAIALILTRAPQGPTLVIAPTSVGMNWINEAQRFAPTLNPIQFGSGDRQTLIDELQPFDLLICTYGLLQQAEVAKMLSEVEWQVIVLDEAQAIKNASTKRSKAAMKLQGEFKILTTGTPIENHLGELWNLFRFITPGLLGSSDQFNHRFAHPIERDENPVARQQLKKLIQPFILRRTKTQVLDELPSRTEIPLYVDLSQEEQTLYEALRQDAIKKLSEKKEAEAGTKHLQVLAEIMKLRRCCCNPELVVPEEALPGTCSKLKLFGEVLEELLSNNHKALVFSQFVDHLAILRRHLDEQQVSYQYLDGSTSAKQRKVRVDAFQAGEGDVFLISLKAGGTGLNLTAADYVIHMDPWWNPAVEDQASDRAHRIGQKRPVTIYRLVTRNTIEEKIVDLHRQKRDLADSLLEGSDMSGKISTEQLLKLIHE